MDEQLEYQHRCKYASVGQKKKKEEDNLTLLITLVVQCFFSGICV